MLNNSLKMPNNTKRNGKMSLKLELAYKNCSRTFNSTQKRVVHNIRFKYNSHANFISRIKSPKKSR